MCWACTARIQMRHATGAQQHAGMPYLLHNWRMITQVQQQVAGVH